MSRLAFLAKRSACPSPCVLESPAYNPNPIPNRYPDSANPKTNPKPNPTDPNSLTVLSLTVFEHLAKHFHPMPIYVCTVYIRDKWRKQDFSNGRVHSFEPSPHRGPMSEPLVWAIGVKQLPSRKRTSGSKLSYAEHDCLSNSFNFACKVARGFKLHIHIWPSGPRTKETKKQRNPPLHAVLSVSYTHLTLPTILRV